jgi:hypothetical protein
MKRDIFGGTIERDPHLEPQIAANNGPSDLFEVAARAPINNSIF